MHRYWIACLCTTTVQLLRCFAPCLLTPLPLLMGFIYVRELLVNRVLRLVEAVKRQCGLEAERQRYIRVEERIDRNTIQDTGDVTVGLIPYVPFLFPSFD